MTNAPSRTQRRHLREKAIDHLVRDVYEPKGPEEKPKDHSPTTSTGLPVEDQVARNGILARAASPLFGDKPQITTVGD